MHGGRVVRARQRRKRNDFAKFVIDLNHTAIAQGEKPVWLAHPLNPEIAFNMESDSCFTADMVRRWTRPYAEIKRLVGKDRELCKDLDNGITVQTIR